MTRKSLGFVPLIWQCAFCDTQNPGPIKSCTACGAGAVFVSAIAAVIPSLIPLVLFREDLPLALRFSNLLSVLMLFITGYRWGKYSGYKPLVTGLIIMSIAILMVILAIPLGG